MACWAFALARACCALAVRAHASANGQKQSPKPQVWGLLPCACSRLVGVWGSKRAQRAQAAEQGCARPAEWCDNHAMSELQQQEAKDPPRLQKPGIRGYALPVGRPKGTKNKVTKTIREAVEKAATLCHPGGLAGWMIDRANGGIQDRQIFAGLVSKVIPLQVQAHVDGGIRIELGWLGGRSVGATAAQVADQQAQVIDMKADSDGVLRIEHPTAPAEAAPASPAAGASEAAGGAER